MSPACSSARCRRWPRRWTAAAADLGDLDPTAALRFPVVDRLDDMAHELGLPSDDLLLAALTADVCADGLDGGGGNCTLELAQRLVPPTEAERIAAIVADAHLLRAGLHETDAFDEAELLQVATHLASAAHARDAYELALAIGGLHRWQREALDERLALIVEALKHPEVTGSEADNLAAVRRLAAEHLLADEPRRDRAPALRRERLPPVARARRAGPAGATGGTVAAQGRGARGGRPLARPGPLEDRRRLPRHRRPVGPPHRRAAGAGCRHRRRNDRHLARRRGARQLHRHQP